MNPLDDRLKNAIRTAVELLVVERYQELEQLTQGQRLSADVMRNAITQYGRTLRTPDNYDQVNLVPVTKGKEQGWSAYVPLYTFEEGRSDLTLLLRVIRTEGGGTTVQLDDIRVL